MLNLDSIPKEMGAASGPLGLDEPSASSAQSSKCDRHFNLIHIARNQIVSRQLLLPFSAKLCVRRGGLLRTVNPYRTPRWKNPPRPGQEIFRKALDAPRSRVYNPARYHATT
jgi:hypothetical protein